MYPDELPDDLRDMEGRLSRRGSVPPPDLRQRVLDAVRREKRAIRSASWVRLAAGLAAAVVLVLNFSLVSVRYTDFVRRDHGDSAQRLTAQAEQLRDLLPELSPDDARHYVLLHNRDNRAPAPLQPLRRPVRPSVTDF